MSDKPAVSAILVNWNGAEHLRVCLPSLLSQSYKPIEIIVVDNCSSDQSEEVARDFDVRWLQMEENIGLAPGLNRGAAIARGDLILFVNNDMRFDKQFVAALVDALLHDQQTFAADGMQYNWDGSVPGHAATRLAKVRPRQSPATELVPGLYFYQEEKADATAVFMASAASMLVRKSLFQELGGFDERLPLGYEDVEICWRAWIHGWKTVYVPNAVCWHRVGSSTRTPEGSRLLFLGVLKGRLLLATKLLPIRYALLTWLISAAGVGKDLILFRWSPAGARIGVLVQYSRYIPRLLREKRALYGARGITAEEQLEFMLRLTSAEGPRAPGHALRAPGGPKSEQGYSIE